jgi:hypothetical protein
VLLAQHDAERGQAVIAHLRTKRGTVALDKDIGKYRVTMDIQGIAGLSRDETNLDIINAMATFERFARLLVTEAITDTIKEEGTKP